MGGLFGEDEFQVTAESGSHDFDESGKFDVGGVVFDAGDVGFVGPAFLCQLLLGQSAPRTGLLQPI